MKNRNFVLVVVLGLTFVCTLAEGQTYTTLTDPLATNGTFASGVSGGDVVGSYAIVNSTKGFLYNTDRLIQRCLILRFPPVQP